MPSTYEPLGKNFGISVNGTQIANIVVTDGNFTDHIFETTFKVAQGLMIFDIFEANTINDTFGSYLGGVEVREMIPIYPLSEMLGPLAPLSYPLLEQTTGSINKIPGNRIFFETLSDFLISFDRLQFYFYHRHNLTYNSYLLLSNINKMAIERGSLTQELFESCDASFCQSVTSKFDGLLTSIDHKK